MQLFVSPHVRRLIDLALDEDDLGFDVTSNAFFAESDARAELVAKQDLVVCGLGLVVAVFEAVDPAVKWTFEASDGEHLPRGTVLGRANGNAANLLRGERTALNFLQRLSGIATMTREYAEALGERTRITDTRKTLPGFRELDKYAVRCGGGTNHRFSLSGGVMIKDNHIAAAGSIEAAMKRVRASAPHTLKVEVEVEDLAGVQAALDAGADIIMLDNMSTPDMKRAVEVIRSRVGDRVQIEASGNVTLERLPELSAIGLDFVSSGALTHSVRAADISMNVT